MEAAPAKVIQYFNGEKQNLIPLFQRPYRWEEPDWKTLWNDVMVQYNFAESANHFMGAIVSVPAKSVPVGVSKYLIIDGQQRLTTVSLLLCALRDSVEEKTGARIQEVYLTNRFRDPEDTLKFVPTQVDRDAYKALVLDKSVPESDSKLVQAYKYFLKQLKTQVDDDDCEVSAERVLTVVEHALQVVMINLGDADDPYLIFESLNFKGQPLTQADLVRNYLMMRFKHSIAAGGEQERIYNAYWRPMESELGATLTEFLRHYAMKDGTDIRQGGIYAATKLRLKDIETPSGVEDDLRQMRTAAAAYGTILNPDKEFVPGIRKRLENIRELQVTTSYPLLLRLFNARKSGQLDDAEFEKCLGLIEAFVVRRQVCAVPTNTLNKLFLQWTKSFPDAGHASWLLQSMSSGGGRKYPTDTEFAEAFIRRPQYGRGATRFILCRLEENFEHHEPVNLNTATIEHVLPQTLNRAWEQDLGAAAADIQSRLLDCFGNLTLTGYNSELGNDAFAIKKEKLAESHIELNRWITARESWSEQEIVERGEMLCATAIRMWPGPLAQG